MVPETFIASSPVVDHQVVFGNYVCQARRPKHRLVKAQRPRETSSTRSSQAFSGLVNFGSHQGVAETQSTNEHALPPSSIGRDRCCVMKRVIASETCSSNNEHLELSSARLHHAFGGSCAPTQTCGSMKAFVCQTQTLRSMGKAYRTRPCIDKCSWH